MRLSALAAIWLLCLPAQAVAGGLFTPDTGTIGLGRGGAWVARASDVPGALYYNPAGLWQVDGWTMAGGVNLYAAQRSLQRTDGPEEYAPTSMRYRLRPHPEVGIAWGLPKPDLTFAIGLTSPLAPIQDWALDGPGRYRLIHQTVRQGNFHFAAAIRPVRFVAFGVSAQLVYMDLVETFAGQADLITPDDEPNPENPDWDVLAEFSAVSIRPQVSIGVMVMPTPWLRIGTSFEPPYRFRGQGSARLSGSVGGESNAVALFGDGPIHVVGEDDDISVDIGLPGRLRFGVDVEPIPQRLSFGLDVHVEIWNGTGDITATGVDMPLMYDDPDDDLPAEPLVDYLYRSGLCPPASILGVDCGDGSSNPPGAGSSLETYRGDGGSITVPADFRDAVSVRFGVEGTPHPALALRLGYLIESPSIPLETQSLTAHDGWKNMLAGGLSLRLGARQTGDRPLVELHVTYAHLWYDDRVVAGDVGRGRTTVVEGVPANPIDAGTYSASVDQVAFGATVHFGAIGQRAAEPVMRR